MDVDLVFRDLQPVDLPDLRWAGGDAHQQALADALEASWTGAVEVLVGEVGGLHLIAQGGVDYRKEPGVGELWMLAVHETWRALGVGTALIAALEERVRAAGLSRVQLTVEEDNPLARDLYERLGYRAIGRRVEWWPVDGGGMRRAPATVLDHRLEPGR